MIVKYSQVFYCLLLLLIGCATLSKKIDKDLYGSRVKYEDKYYSTDDEYVWYWRQMNYVPKSYKIEKSADLKKRYGDSFITWWSRDTKTGEMVALNWWQVLGMGIYMGLGDIQGAVDWNQSFTEYNLLLQKQKEKNSNSSRNDAVSHLK